MGKASSMLQVNMRLPRPFFSNTENLHYSIVLLTNLRPCGLFAVGLAAVILQPDCTRESPPINA